MKLTKSRLKQLIREKLEESVGEGNGNSCPECGKVHEGSCGQHADLQEDIEDGAEDHERNPKVVANCLCEDCIFNRNKRCIKESIDLQFAQKEDGSTICECVTYEQQDHSPSRRLRTPQALDEQ